MRVLHCVILLLLAPIAPALGQEPEKKPKVVEPAFDFKFRKPADSIAVVKQAKRTLLVVTSASGIGDATITLKAGQWPDDIAVRFQYGKDKGFDNLEQIEITTDRVHARGSKKLSEKFPFVFLDAKRNTAPIEREPSGVLNVRVTVRDGAIEVSLPTYLLIGSGEVRLHWTDAFR
jgi:hypothetical protein